MTQRRWSRDNRQRMPSASSWSCAREGSLSACSAVARYSHRSRSVAAPAALCSGTGSWRVTSVWKGSRSLTPLAVAHEVSVLGDGRGRRLGPEVLEVVDELHERRARSLHVARRFLDPDAFAVEDLIAGQRSESL